MVSRGTPSHPTTAETSKATLMPVGMPRSNAGPVHDLRVSNIGSSRNGHLKHRCPRQVCKREKPVRNTPSFSYSIANMFTLS